MKFHDEDDMGHFISEQKQKLARDREVLANNPTSAVNEYDINGTANPRRVKEQQLEAESIQVPKQKHQPTNNNLKTKPPTPQFLKLGQDYEKQKEKLKEELRKEYREALAEKQIRGNGMRRVNNTNYETKESSLGLSLPIRDHLSAKERLKLQRNKEYNAFLTNKENEESLSPRRLKTWATPVVLPDEVQQYIKYQESAHSQSKQFKTYINYILSKAISLLDEQRDGGDQSKPVKTNETYQDILDRKRKQEKAYRNMEEDDDLDDKVLYRGKVRQRLAEDADYRGPKKAVRFPQGRRRYEDDDADSLDSEEVELIRRIRRRKDERRSRRYEEDSDEEEEAQFEKVKHKNMRSVREQQQPRRLNSAQAQNQSQSVRSSLDKKSLDLRSRSAPPEEYTGLNIGNVPSANTVQRRKEEYKMELQKQMEDNIAIKKRNRALDLQPAANEGSSAEKTVTGITSSIKVKQSSLKSENEPKRTKKKKQTSFRRESSESDSEDDRRKPSKYFPRHYPMPPHHPSSYPPPMAQQQFQSPYDEAYYYYGARNPLDPASMGMQYAPPQGMASPGAFPNGTSISGVSPMMTAAQSRMQDESVELPSLKSTGKTSRSGGFKMANVESSLISDETRDTVMKREKMLTYQEELKEQMKFKEKKKNREKLEQERYDQKIENEANNYNPWGKGGGGAPMRDVHGNLISDLRQMHLVNEDLVRDPSKVVELVKEQKKVQTQEDLTVLSPRQKTIDSDSGGVTSPRFGRSNPFEVKETSRQKSQRDLYKDDLQRQIDERRRMEEKRKEEEREAEEREERKIAEQNKKLQEEYEMEKLKQREKIEEKLRQNAQLHKSLEDKKKMEHQKKLEEQKRRDDEARAQKENELQEKLKKQTSAPVNNELHGNQNLPRTPVVNTHRSDVQASVATTYNNPPTSPPQQQQYNQPQQQQYTQQSQQQYSQQEQQYAQQSQQQYSQQQQQYTQPQYSNAQQPQYQQLPLPASVRPPKSRESKRISRELSALRKQLLSEQRRVENELKTQEPVFQFGGYRPTKLKTETLVDLSKVRQRPIQVRRPTTSDRPSSAALKDFKEIKHGDDTESLRMFRVEHPDTPSDTSALVKQQEDLIRTQTKKLNNLRQGISDQPRHSRRSPTKDSRNGFSLLPPSDSYASLLDADSMMIPVVDDLENRPPSSELLQRKKYSARERRRSSRRNVDEEGGLTYRAAAQDTYSLNSLTSLATLDVERMASKNQERLNKLKALTGDEVSLTDPDDILDRFVNQHKNDTNAVDIDQKIRADAQSRMNDRPSSVNTLDTEPWLRPSTGPIAAT